MQRVIWERIAGVTGDAVPLAHVHVMTQLLRSNVQLLLARLAAAVLCLGALR